MREPSSLTERERQVVNLVAHGKDAREISTLLSISMRTVEAHVTTSRLKLTATNRAHMVMLACASGYVDGFSAPAKQADED